MMELDLILAAFKPFQVNVIFDADSIRIDVSMYGDFIRTTYYSQRIEFYGFEYFEILIQSMRIDFNRRIITKLSIR